MQTKIDNKDAAREAGQITPMAAKRGDFIHPRSGQRVRVISGDYKGYAHFIAANRGSNDTQLCNAQMAARRMGWRTHEIHRSLYGWCLRAASGLDNWSVVATNKSLRSLIRTARWHSNADAKFCVFFRP